MPAVLITGAAHGLGKSTALKFIAEGWTVILVDKEEITLNSAVGLVRSFQCDVTDGEGLLKIRDTLKEEHISIDVLVNNAGFFKFFPITDSKAEDLEYLFKVNTLAPFRLINIFRQNLIENKGRVIQVSSENVKLSGLFQPYPSSKIALESLSIGARQELALLGVKLIIVEPGAINTRLLNWNEPNSATYRKYLTRFMNNARKRMGKIAAPEDVAEVIWKVATVTKPKSLYRYNHNRWLSMFSRFSKGMQERIILRMLRN